jgi:hypothetical protein
MAPAHESETIVFNFRKLLSTLPNYAELERYIKSIKVGKPNNLRVLGVSNSKGLNRIAIILLFMIK